MDDTERKIREFLRNNGDRLHHRENQELEFKEQFNLAGIAEYLRDFAAFSNNKGGYIIFGVKDSPRIAQGLSGSSSAQFEKLDPQVITGFILEIFSSEISWSHDVIIYQGKKFGYFRVFEHGSKPIITKKDEGKNQELRNGDIYYRYGGRTQRIQSGELENIISNRINETNRCWTDLMSKIGKIGPQNAALLNTETGIIEKGSSQVLVIDEELAKKLTFIKEGEFSEKEGKQTLKLVGDIVPLERIEVIKKEKEHLIKSYPLSGAELANEVKRRYPNVGQNKIWEIIKDNCMKANKNYSAYNFRNKKHEDEFEKEGIFRTITPSIYNYHAVELICKILDDCKK